MDFLDGGNLTLEYTNRFERLFRPFRVRADGRYLIVRVPPGTYEVRAEIIGFTTATRSVAVVAGQTVVVDFQLRETAIALDEIVVTGTAGAARRREVGNSIAAIDERLLQLKPVTDVNQILQGEVTGLVQFTQEGQVGAGTAIRLRGNNSVSQSNEPLIYIDGVRMTSAINPGAPGSQQRQRPLDNLNPDDMERIEVIRGAAATTLYGTEANSGVIQIFTKRGGGDRAVWSFEASEGARFLTANALGPVVGKHKEPRPCDAQGSRFCDDWVSLKPWVETGLINELSGSVRGTAAGVDYYLSAEYSFNEGVMPTQDATRTGFRTNLGFEPLAGLKIAVNSAYSHRNINWVQSGDNADGVVLNLLRSPKNYTSGADSVLFGQKTRSVDDQFVGGITATYAPWPSVTNRFTLGLDWVDGFNEFAQPFNFLLYPPGYCSANRWRHTTVTVDYVGTWSQRFSSALSSQFSWGCQVFNGWDHRQYGTAENFPGPGEHTLSSGALRLSSESMLKSVSAGFFFQELVGINDRIFLTAGLRVDGNSAFGKDFGLQPYPKFSWSWVISDEPWWAEGWPVLKLRGAIGESGKAPGAFDAVRTWDPISAYEGKSGVTPANLGDPNLGPERTREIEIGFEGSAFGDRIGLDFSWYRAVTQDALVPVQYPPSQGFVNPQLTNVGELLNQGVEVALRVTPVRTDNLT